MAPAFVLVTKYPPPLVESCSMAPKPTVVALPAPLPKVICSKPVFGAMVPVNELVVVLPGALTTVSLVIAMAKSKVMLVLEMVSAPSARETAKDLAGGLVQPEPVANSELVKPAG